MYFFEEKYFTLTLKVDPFVVETLQKKHRLAASFFEPDDNKQINSVSRFEDRTGYQSSPKDWLNRQVYSVEVSS